LNVLILSISLFSIGRLVVFVILEFLANWQLKVMENTSVDKVFRDNEGNIVIAQMPNLPLIVWIVTSILALIFTTGKINTLLDVLANGSLFTWAWLELSQGVNYFRRALGLIVLAGLIAYKVINDNGFSN
jgi:hypothetical protein